MTDVHTFMIFGAVISLSGFYLAATAKAGQGQTTIKVFGAEITLAAAGGILVMFFGILTFSAPAVIAARSPKPAPPVTKYVEISKDIEAPDPTNEKEKARYEALIANGPASPREVSAYLSAASTDIMRYPSVDYGGAGLVNLGSKSRTLVASFNMYGVTPTHGQMAMAGSAIQQQLCRITGLRKALSMGGTVRLELTSGGPNDTMILQDARFIDCG